MGYSLCMVADFQSALTCRIFGVFGAVFCREQLQMICRMDFDRFFWNFNFLAKVRILHGL